MADYLLADRAELAWVTYLSTIEGLPTCVAGKNATDKELPLVICECSVGEEETRLTGNFWVDSTITLVTTANPQAEDETPVKDSNLTYLSLLDNAIYVDNLEALLAASASEFHIFDVSVQRMGSTRNQDDEGIWRDAINLRFMACASDIS